MIRENNIKNRVISTFLAISMLVTSLFNSAFATAYAETSAYEENIGCTAIFNTNVYDYFPVSDDPSNLSWDTEYQLIGEDLGENFKVVITDYYISDNKGDLPCLWYKVEAALDCNAPEKLIQYPWVFQNYLGENADAYDSLIIEKIEKDNITVFDEEGNEVGEQIELPQYEKKKLIGESSLSGDVAYQWQILIDDTWIDIYGQDKAEFTLTYGVVASVLDDFQAKIRLITKKSSNVIKGDAVTVTVIPYEEDELIEDEVQREEITTDHEVYNNGEEVAELKINNDNIDDNNDPIENGTNAEYSIMKLSAFSNVDDVNGVMLADENGGSESELETYTVIINYIYQDGKTAAQSWSGTFSKGVEVKATIESPTVTGFAPDCASYTVDITSITEDTTYTVIYYPAEVNFTVYHYQQNVDNDDYTLKETVTDKGFTGATVGENLKREYEGFYAYNYDTTLEIAADGSTKVEIYYDRYYYLMSFDLNGGYGVEPIYARYGTLISIGTPNRPGYSFASWDSSLPLTMPAGNNRFTAQWTAGDTSFNVVFLYENANDDGYSVAGSYGPVSATAGVTVTSGDYSNQNFEGRDAEHFTYNAAKAETTTVAGDGSTILNVYYTRNVYTVDFIATGLCGIENHIHSDACKTLICEMPVHDHATAECKQEQVCDLEEHNHTPDCLNCSKEEHNHSTACCSLSVHTHVPSTCCSLEENDHTHSDSCCTIEEHTHSDSCCQYEGTSWGHWLHSDECCKENKSAHEHNSWRYNCSCDIESHTHSDRYNWQSSCNTDKCGLTEHAHDDGNCNYGNCGGYEHVHSEACYKDVAHTHDDGCYSYTCNQIAHTHIDTCYRDCGKDEHTCFGSCFNASATNIVKRINAKYDSDISATWETAPIKGYLDDGYVFKSSLTSKYYSYLEKMPGSDITMTATQWSGNTYTWYYWLQVLPGQDTTDLETKSSNGVTYYKYHTTTVNGDDISLTYEEDYFPITGFTQRDDSVPSFSNRKADLYYLRNQYNLKFMNYGVEVTEKTENIYYQADISDTYFVPEYPANLEPYAYEFDGWYTSPYYGDTQFNFTTTDEDGNTIKATMPANDLILYAKWTPRTHAVKIYKTNALNEQIGETQRVSHGSRAEEPKTLTNGSYSFVGWFYVGSDSRERAFDFSMPVNQDLVLYAKWSSNVLVNYTIRYAVEESNGTYTYIAQDTVGQALAGTPKTFLAKAGEDLDDGYREGYFPETSSHSITLSADDSSENTFTFVYVPIKEVNYIVRYIDKATQNPLKEDKKHTTTKAIVTENFLPIQGYMPDAYQKTLVLSANGENIITFWYTVDIVHAPVQVIHYIQNAAGKGYTVYQNISNLNTKINDTFSTPILSIVGFSFEYATANGKNIEYEAGSPTVSGKVTDEGLVLELYYNRNTYPYEFRFVEEGTERVLADSVTGTARYGAQVVQNAEPINGYTSSSNSGAITIKIEEGETAYQNVYTFYYERALADLTIIKSGANEDVDENQSFIFKVTGIDDNTKDISITVVVHGNGGVTIKDLPVGKYTVEEITDWSWRYSSEKEVIQTVDVGADGKTVPFNNKRDNEFWLDGNAAYCDNRFGRKDSLAEEEVAADE